MFSIGDVVNNHDGSLQALISVFGSIDRVIVESEWACFDEGSSGALLLLLLSVHHVYEGYIQ